MIFRLFWLHVEIVKKFAAYLLSSDLNHAFLLSTSVSC